MDRLRDCKENLQKPLKPEKPQNALFPLFFFSFGGNYRTSIDTGKQKDGIYLF